MRKVGLVVLLMSVLLGHGVTVFARGGGGHLGGAAAGKMSTEGQANTNAQWSSGADKGQQRAEERRSEQGAENEKAKAWSQATPPEAAKLRKRTHQ